MLPEYSHQSFVDLKSQADSKGNRPKTKLLLKDFAEMSKFD